jgi:transcriptional regulator with XRE-family HTH domain
LALDFLVALTYIAADMRNKRETVGQFVKRTREARGLTQTAVARAAGIGNAFLSDIEHDRRGFGPKVLVDLAKALKIFPQDLARRVSDQEARELSERVAEHA